MVAGATVGTNQVYEYMNEGRFPPAFDADTKEGGALPGGPMDTLRLGGGLPVASSRASVRRKLRDRVAPGRISHEGP